MSDAQTVKELLELFILLDVLTCILTFISGLSVGYLLWGRKKTGEKPSA